MKIIIFHSILYKIGGTETFTHNLCKALAPYYDVLLLYNKADIEQLRRIAKYVKCEKYQENNTYTADVCICSTAWGGYPDNVTANEYIQMIHADYKLMKEKYNWEYRPWAKTTKHLAVSQSVCDVFNQLHANRFSATVMYNLLDEIQPIRLNLLSAMRYTAEKGINRMVILAEALKAAKIPFHWRIFTPKSLYPNAPYMNMPEVEYLEPIYDIYHEMRLADYGVQLSDTEGYSYFINECLQYKTPVLVTDFPSAHESIKDGYNGYILPMDMKGIDVNKIYNNIPKLFRYSPKTTVQNWIDLLGKPEKTENYIPPAEPDTVTVKIITDYNDLRLNRLIKAGEELTVPFERAILLQKKNIAQILNQ